MAGGKTLTTNLANRIRGFNLREQDKTIRDAVEVTRYLGLRYLWIDALCIVQDDPHDKAREIGRMHEVYQRATLTVSASRAQASTQGFLGTCTPIFSQRLRYIGPGGGAEGSVIASVTAPNTSLSTEPINTRGWTLQEHLLSRRVLIFGTYGLKWACNHIREFDGSQEDQGWATAEEMVGLSHHDGAYASRVLTWHEVVAKFRERHLTAHEDRLPAVSAVAAAYKRLRNPGRYMAGLWSSTLPEDLLWEVIPRRSSIYFMSDPLMTRAAMDEVVDHCSERDQGPSGSDASEDDEEFTEDDDFEPITYSVGLLLKPMGMGDNSFSRVGIYKMQDIHDDYYNVTDSGLSLRPHFWEWRKCFTANDIKLV
ncbi:putative het domain-containing protein [Diaporthe ampelina]|uniref:Putative het domain-containing protein n=1 Tax=Diaporthe ampelina TaxID=1214573 RepID=A0A0G2FUE9_9PEZI|nr:putative het domain-containing protein [Diaporthe ampelina]